MQNFNSKWMRKDAKITFLLVEVVCVSVLAAYLIQHIFAVDLGVSGKDALSAGLVASFGGLIYFLHSAVVNALDGAKR